MLNLGSEVKVLQVEARKSGSLHSHQKFIQKTNDGQQSQAGANSYSVIILY